MRKGFYHPNFDEYVEMIIGHPNYKGLEYERKKDGRVKWVVTKKTPQGKKRQEWWNKKCREQNAPCSAAVARRLHPTGKHVCQCCGEERSIFYEYPAKRTVPILNRILKTTIDKDNDENRAECTIREIIEGWCNSDNQILAIAKAFGLPNPNNKKHLIELIYSELVNKNNTRFSPGVMCNPPDRYNGFHSYALCCRTKYDTGRHPDNMQTYSRDRRAYEEWADGDYFLANRLMGEIRKQPPMICPICKTMAKMSADHIGPISLGFCHSKHFAPMCKKCNSSKNNRFTKNDVDVLLHLELQGEQIISWHSKYIWDMLKHRIHNDDDARKVSSIMAKCHQNVLNILALIYKETGKEFLMRYLHPEYSLKEYKFKHLDMNHLEEVEIISTFLDNENRRKSQKSYIRIAFESLEDFNMKKNRKKPYLINEHSSQIKDIIKSIRSGNFEESDRNLNSLIQWVSDELVMEWKVRPEKK